MFHCPRGQQQLIGVAASKPEKRKLNSIIYNLPQWAELCACSGRKAEESVRKQTVVARKC
eukprot:scaffold2858_cov659-Pavlova_lutheri.AAC.67